MFNVRTLLLDDTFKPAMPLTMQWRDGLPHAVTFYKVV